MAQGGNGGEMEQGGVGMPRRASGNPMHPFCNCCPQRGNFAVKRTHTFATSHLVRPCCLCKPLWHPPFRVQVDAADCCALTVYALQPGISRAKPAGKTLCRLGLVARKDDQSVHVYAPKHCLARR